MPPPQPILSFQLTYTMFRSPLNHPNSPPAPPMEDPSIAPLPVVPHPTGLFETPGPSNLGYLGLGGNGGHPGGGGLTGWEAFLKKRMGSEQRGVKDKHPSQKYGKFEVTRKNSERPED